MRKSILFAFLFVALIYAHPAKGGEQSDKGDRSWSILQSWDIPGKASGLAFDGTYLYFGIYGSDGDHFYRFNPSDGSIQQQFINPNIGDCFGMTWDGSALWIVNQPASSSNPSQATRLNLSGAILSQFDLPDHYMSGIAWDAGDFWAGTYYPDPGTTYQVDNTGNVISQFTPPADQIWDICMQDNNLWMVDYNGNMIYKTDQSGNIIESHPSEGIKPAGIVYDGTNLWYVDGQLSSQSKLYKVSLTGAGTPEINIPVTSHHYGIVTIGSSETWSMEVENVGNANLVVTGVVIPGLIPVSTTFSPPQTITPGHSIFIPLTYSPLTIGHLNTTISVISSDPITPSEQVTLTGDGVNSGPSLYVPVNTYDYGLVRKNAFTRWFLEIENVGDATLIITNLTTNDEVFIMDESIVLPIQIEPLDSVMVGVWFNPLAESIYSGKVQIDNNDPMSNPYYVNLGGEGEDRLYPIGEPLWQYDITTGFDQSPKAIASIEDITGDTVADVIVCSEDYYVRCLNGNSSGIADVMWEVSISGGSVYNQSALTIISDVNGDGYQDVVVGTTGGDRSIRIHSGKTGQLIWRHNTHEYGEGGWVYQVSANYDYNNDGLPDVLASVGDDGGDTGPRRVYCLNAVDGLSIWETYVGGPVFSVIGVADFTGDNQPDVIAGASNAGETQGKVIGIDGSNGSILWTKNTGGSSVWALMQLDDITGDGIKDVVAGDFGGNFYYINPVNNTQIFQGSISGALILGFENMKDVNGDGYSDVLVAHSKANGIVLDGFDGTTIWYKSLNDKSWNVAAVDDITGDGISDALIGTLFSNNYCYFMNGVDGEELESIDYDTPIDALRGIPDIVGDGTMEMVAGGRDGKVYCFSGGLGLLVGMDETETVFSGASSTHYPNPFSNQITIAYGLEGDSFVTIHVFDINGQVIATLVNEYLGAGQHATVWDGKDAKGNELPSGFYFYEIITDKGKTRNKVVKL